MRNEVEIMGGIKMKTVQAIIDKRGGIEALKDKYIKVYNDPYMKLVIELLGQGPYETDIVSVAHYYTQNGDAMRDPEIVFLVKDNDWLPVSYRNDSLGAYRQAMTFENGQARTVKPLEMRELMSFAKMWNRNIRLQGYLDLVT